MLLLPSVYSRETFAHVNRLLAGPQLGSWIKKLACWIRSNPLTQVLYVWQMLVILQVSYGWLIQVHAIHLPGRSSLFSTLYNLCISFTLDEFTTWYTMYEFYTRFKRRTAIQMAAVGCILPVPNIAATAKVWVFRAKRSISTDSFISPLHKRFSASPWVLLHVKASNAAFWHDGHPSWVDAALTRYMYSKGHRLSAAVPIAHPPVFAASNGTRLPCF